MDNAASTIYFLRFLHSRRREEGEETAGRRYGARYARDTGGEWRKREADKGSVLLQSEASEIFYELNCAGGLSAACRNRCPKISRPTVVTDYLDICPSIFRYFPHNFLPSSWIFLRNRIPRAFTFTFTFFPFYFACTEGNFGFAMRVSNLGKIRRHREVLTSQ